MLPAAINQRLFIGKSKNTKVDKGELMGSKLRRIPLFVISTLLAGGVGVANASGYNQFIGFGDSTMDSGYFRHSPTGGHPPHLPGATLDAMIAATVAAGGSGAFVGPGVVTTIQLAEQFGLAADPVTKPGGGSNYANGSAQTFSTTQENDFSSGLYNNVPVTAQVIDYLASVNDHANPDALYMFSVGGNDLAWLDEQVGADRPEYIHRLSSELSSSIIALRDSGARHIMVLSPYSYGRSVEESGFVPDAALQNILGSAQYASEVRSILKGAGVNFVSVDIEGLLKYVTQNPTRFGFTEESVLAKNPACGSQSALICTPSQMVSPDAQKTHLWSDGRHLSTAGQRLSTDLMHSLLTAPVNVSLIAEKAIQSGFLRTATIQRQLEVSGQHRGAKGLTTWAAAGYSFSKHETVSFFPSAAGNSPQGTVGVDYRGAFGISFGAAFTADSQSPDFSTGGNFDQDSQTLTIYSLYQHSRFWGNALASYSFLQNDIERSVKLGLLADRNRGEADGHAISFALRGGYDFKIGKFTASPIVGAILQQSHIDGFIEKGTTGITALSFDSQTRDSQVSQLGLRGFMELGAWRPFFEAVWNHEWNDKHRTVTTTLTSVDAPSYNSMATPVSSGWGNAALGVSYMITPSSSIRGAFSGVMADSEKSNYGAELILSVNF